MESTNVLDLYERKSGEKGMEDNKIDWRVLGNRIADMRLSRGITQIQLAEMTGLSRVYIGYIEQGKRCGTIMTYLDIVTALGYSLNDLVGKNLSDVAPELILELSSALRGCSADEKDSIVRIFREMLSMIRMFREDDPADIVK